ncbi:MAG: cytochrome c oxidase subunit II [Chloroflexi bacterium]|nr:cytochrome c oxidase subunit II [Chloroflexota bacterium]
MIHVHVYEKWWIGLTVAMLIAFSLAIGVSGFMMGIQLPSPEALVNPNTVAKQGDFANPGLKELAPKKYVAYIRAEANPWKFRPEKIEVPVGSTVTFYVTAVDVQHGFKLEGTNINVQILPGQVSKMTATFNQKGEFPFVCTEFCGVGHQNMFGKLIVK